MINKATLLGTIIDKKSRQTKDGRTLCTISVETYKRYMNSSGKECKETTWHIVNFFDKTGDTAKRLCDINDIIYVEGEITNKKIDDNGTIRTVSAIKGNLMQVIKSNDAK